MYGVATQNGVGVSLGNIPALTSLAYPQMLNAIVLGAFSGGAPGWLYDDTNQSTLFQDAAGTTPVTALEQPVGLQLDLSQGLVLGSELVTNGGPFTTTTGWANTTPGNGTLTASGGLLTLTTTNTDFATFAITTVIGKWYKVSTTIASAACPGFYGIRKADDASVTTNVVTFINTLTGSGGGYFLATATTSYIVLQINGAGTASISFASCKSIAGNHRYQPTSANRPTWSARYNLLTKTDFSTSWLGSSASVVANNAVAQDGTTTAATITTTVAGGIIYQGNTLAAGSHTTIGVFKAGSVSSIKLECVTAAYATGASAPFDLSAGTKGTVTNYGATTGSTSTITPLGSGYYLCSLTITATAATHFTQLIGMTIGTFTAWHPDLRPSDQATGLIPTYQRVNTATDYDSVGFPAGLRWNGSNSWMQNASVDFSGTNKVAIFVGARKQSDAALAVLTELSATIASNNGTFLLSAPNSAAANLNFSSKGTTQVDDTVTTYTSPTTRVIAGIADIGLPSNIIMVNGAQVGSVLTTQGTGNFSNSPAFFGARNGASAFFSGMTYSNCAIGGGLSASQIAAFNAWTNSKARAY